MTRELRITKSFKQDYKKLNSRERQDADEIIQKLLANQSLEPRNHDHPLHGSYEGYRECHIHPDLLLVYKKNLDDSILILTCYRISSHTNIF